MKIVITSQGMDLKSVPDPRFGRAAFFLVIDNVSLEILEVINNNMKDASGGAGVAAGQTVAATGAKVLITGALGPKAFEVLAESAMESYAHNNEASVEKTIVAFNEDKLKRIQNSKRG